MIRLILFSAAAFFHLGAMASGFEFAQKITALGNSDPQVMQKGADIYIDYFRDAVDADKTEGYGLLVAWLKKGIEEPAGGLNRCWDMANLAEDDCLRNAGLEPTERGPWGSNEESMAAAARNNRRDAGIVGRCGRLGRDARCECDRVIPDSMGFLFLPSPASRLLDQAGLIIDERSDAAYEDSWQKINEMMRRDFGFAQIQSSEGMPYYALDIAALNERIGDILPPDVLAYGAMEDKESKESAFEDAGLVISLDEYVERLISAKEFLDKYPGSAYFDKAWRGYKERIELLFGGRTDNWIFCSSYSPLAYEERLDAIRAVGKLDSRYAKLAADIVRAAKAGDKCKDDRFDSVDYSFQ